MAGQEGKIDSDPEDYSVSEVYVWGADESGQLGLGNQNRSKVYTIPRFCSFNVQIKMISCGEEHAAMIANAGYVYTMGSNQHGRLGIGNRTIPYSIKPYIVEALTFHRVKFISAGFAHSAAVTGKLDQNPDMGELFTWGLGEYGALGVNSRDNLWSPMRVAFPDVPNAHVSKVSCGMKHSAIIDDKGRLYTTGSNENGQLGTGHKRGQLMPALITTINDRMIQVSAGIAHTLVLTKSGRVFAMGSNSSGELGTGSKRDSHYPLQVKDLEPFNINKVAAGHHSAAVTDNGDLYIWGKGSFGEYSRPTRVAGLRVAIKDISVGSYSAGAIDYDGNVWTWGSNAKGQLGLGNYQSSEAPVLVEAVVDKRIRQLGVGGSFMISLSKSDNDQGYGCDSPLRSPKIETTNQRTQPRATGISPLRKSKPELRESNTSVRFAAHSGNESSYSPGNRGRGGVGGPLADTPERYRRGATKSPSGGAPRPIVYREPGRLSGSSSRAPLRGRSRSKKLNESQISGTGRQESPAYRAALARLNDVTRDKDALEADLLRERRYKENVQDDLQRAYRQIDHLETTSPHHHGELDRLNIENERLRESIRNQERGVANLGDELGERNRQIEYLRDRLSAIERDNKDIAERVAIDHQRNLREKQSEIEMLRGQLRESEARSGFNLEEAKGLEEKYIRQQNMAENERKAREDMELDSRKLRALLEDEKTRNRALNDELAIAHRNQDSVAHDYSRDIERLKGEFEQRISQKNQELEHLRRAVQDLKYEKDDVLGRVSSHSHENQVLRKEIIAWKEMVNKHVDENTELKKIIEDLEAKNRKLSQSLDYYLYNRAADYKERTLQALQRNQELLKGRARPGQDQYISPNRVSRVPGNEAMDTRTALENVNRMIGRDRQNLNQIRQHLSQLPREGANAAPTSLTPHSARSPVAPARTQDEFERSAPEYQEDPRYVKSNYALVKDLDQKERTPVPDRARYADESAITAGGRVGDPLTVSQLRHSSPPRNASPVEVHRRASRSPNRYDDYEKEMLRRERIERNREIESRHANALGSAQRIMDILEISSPIRRREGVESLTANAPGLNVSPVPVEESHLRVSPHRKSYAPRQSQGADTTAVTYNQRSYGGSPERYRGRDFREERRQLSPGHIEGNNTSAAIITKGVVKNLKDDVSRKLDSLKKNKEAIDSLLIRGKH